MLTNDHHARGGLGLAALAAIVSSVVLSELATAIPIGGEWGVPRRMMELNSPQYVPDPAEYDTPGRAQRSPRDIEDYAPALFQTRFGPDHEISVLSTTTNYGDNLMREDIYCGANAANHTIFEDGQSLWLGYRVESGAFGGFSGPVTQDQAMSFDSRYLAHVLPTQVGFAEPEQTGSTAIKVFTRVPDTFSWLDDGVTLDDTSDPVMNPCFNDDASRIYVAKHNGSYWEIVSRVWPPNAGTWSDEKSEVLNGSWNARSPFITEDGLIMYFSCDKGNRSECEVTPDYDIWISTRTAPGDDWGTPYQPVELLNLNTGNHEIDPAVGWAGGKERLYFARAASCVDDDPIEECGPTEGGYDADHMHPDYPGYDIYESIRGEDFTIPSSKPVRPYNLSSHLDKGYVVLQWTDLPAADMYRVYREAIDLDQPLSTKEPEWIGVTTEPGYTDYRFNSRTAVHSGATLTYHVSAINSAGEGCWSAPESIVYPSNQGNAITWDIAVSNVPSDPLDKDYSIDLHWYDPPGFQFNRVHRGYPTYEAFTHSSEINAATTPANDDDVQLNTYYVYSIHTSGLGKGLSPQAASNRIHWKVRMLSDVYPDSEAPYGDNVVDCDDWCLLQEAIDEDLVDFPSCDLTGDDEIDVDDWDAFLEWVAEFSSGLSCICDP